MFSTVLQRDPVDIETLRKYEGNKRDSSHKSPGKFSRPEARNDNVMMQRWLNEAPGEEPFSSVSYYAKKDKKPQ